MLVGIYSIINFVKHKFYYIQTYFIVPNRLCFNAVINDLYNNAFAHYATEHPVDKLNIYHKN